MKQSEKATRIYRENVVNQYVSGVTGEVFQAWRATSPITCANDACGRGTVHEARQAGVEWLQSTTSHTAPTALSFTPIAMTTTTCKGT